MTPLKELRQEIEDEARYVDIKSHSHNIITTCLGAIARDHGVKAANQAVRDFDLERKGWNQQ